MTWQSVDWLIGYAWNVTGLISWLIDWLIDCSIDWLIYCCIALAPVVTQASNLLFIIRNRLQVSIIFVRIKTGAAKRGVTYSTTRATSWRMTISFPPTIWMKVRIHPFWWVLMGFDGLWWAYPWSFELEWDISTWWKEMLLISSLLL